MFQLVEYFPCKHKGRNSNLKIHIKNKSQVSSMLLKSQPWRGRYRQISGAHRLPMLTLVSFINYRSVRDLVPNKRELELKEGYVKYFYGILMHAYVCVMNLHIHECTFIQTHIHTSTNTKM